jgi:Carboxypeptidase regulatory-like domain
VNLRKTGSRKKSVVRNFWPAVCFRAASLCLVAGLLLVWPFPAFSRSQPQAPPQSQPQTSPNPPSAAEEEPPRAEQRDGTISGTVVDATGAVVAGAIVELSRGNQSLRADVTTDSDGQFFFRGIAAGPFQLTITSPGFTTQTSSGTLQAGEDYTAPPVVLAVAASASQVRVSMTPVEIAEAEIKDEEKQRVLGVIPNFYVTYNHSAAPLNPKQKFELAWKLTVDPVNFGLTAAIAGIQQASNSFSGYGQGAQGYGKRLGAAYADSVTSTFIGGAILPSLLRQDPRYFYKGTGSRRGRFFYALANAVICKGDNGHWQANYSAVLGSLAAGGISNLYYPESDRDVTVTLENTLIGIGASAANNVLQEFVIRKLTRNAPTYSQARSQP